MSIFSKIQSKFPKRTAHNLSYSTKFELPFGQLVPIYCEKVVPGDKIFHSHEFFMRFAPFVNQVFQGFQIRTEYFFVPSRLLWKNFEMWLSKGMTGSSDYVHPYISLKYLYQNYSVRNLDMINTIFDYFNLPTLFKDSNGNWNIDYMSIDDDLMIDALPFFAYIKIFLDYYADENLEYASIIERLENQQIQFAVDGNSITALANLFTSINGVSASVWSGRYNCFKRSWPKDYFTSALPSAQRGPIVQIPLNGSGDIEILGENNGYRYRNVVADYTDAPAGSVGQKVRVSLHTHGRPIVVMNEGQAQSSPELYAGIAGATGGTVSDASANGVTEAIDPATKMEIHAININGTATITDLRTAIAIQQFLEKRARGGSRAKEQIYSSFGVRAKDYRLDRSEMLQATCNYLNIGEVYTATANEDETEIPGMAISTGKSASSSKLFKHFFDEHGYVIGLMSVFPTASYYQGIPRQFLELDQFDYYWPEFQHIGEQAVDKCELMIGNDNGTRGTFGYQPRYAQYKSRVNQIHGQFRNNLKFMTAAREFSSMPTLSNAFVQINPVRDNLNKVFRTTTPIDSSCPVFVDLYHHAKFIRPMSYFGTPRFL